MEKLRDKLNNVPQDFDREKLWNNIKPKKKKKRFLWFWLLPIAVSTFFLYNSGLIVNNANKNYTLTDEEILESNKPSPKEPISNDEETIILNNINPNQTEKVKTTTNRNEIETLTSQQSHNSFQPINRSINKVKNSQIAQNNSSQSLNFDEYNNTDNTSVADLLGDNSSVYFKKQLQTKNESIRSVIDIERIEKISFDLLLHRSNELKNQFNFRDLKPHIQARAKSDLPFYLSLGIGAGVDRHNFDAIFRENEMELESLTTSIELEQFLTKRFSIAGGLIYTRNTTNLNFQEEQSIVGLTDGFFTNDRYVTTYDLYNHYSRFDATVNLKYTLQVKKINLSPSLGIGYNLSSMIDGDLLTDEGELLPLSSETYKENSGIFGNLRLDLGYELDNNMILGLSSSIQTERSIGKENRHSIRPIQMSVFIRKVIF